MSENNIQVGAFSVRCLEPGDEMLGLSARRAFVAEVERAVDVAIAYAGKAIRDKTHPFPFLEPVRPFVGGVAVHMRKELTGPRPAQERLDFGGAVSGLIEIPLRRKSGMNQAVVLVVMEQWSMAQPVEQLIPVGSLENGIQSILFSRRRMIESDSKQMEVVIAENGHGGISKLFDITQRLQ